MLAEASVSVEAGNAVTRWNGVARMSGRELLMNWRMSPTVCEWLNLATSRVPSCSRSCSDVTCPYQRPPPAQPSGAGARRYA
jgi:hypothetical protein